MLGGTGVLLVLIAGLGILAMKSLAVVQAGLDEAAGPIAEKLTKAGMIAKLAQQARAAELRVIVNIYAKNYAGQDQFRREETDSMRDLAAAITAIRPLLSLEKGRAAMRRAEENLGAWQKVDEDLYRLLAADKPDEAQKLFVERVKPLIDGIVDSSNVVIGINQNLVETARNEAAEQYASIRWQMSGMLLFALLVAGAIAWMMRGIARTLRDIVMDLASGGEQVAAASAQIASTSQTLSQGSSEQAASLEEVSASMEEMTAMTKRNAENSAEAMAVMTETVSQVDRSNRALQEMLGSMGAIKDSSEKVAKINKTIDEIAFQTNILALNAAVEAARAGEAGMGFAVVADEVRNLAQRSALAAKDTAALIEEAIANSNGGAAKLEQVVAAVRAITDSAGKVRGLVDEVSEASMQQSSGIAQVATAVNQVSQVTQTAAASAEESAAASEELSAQSESVSHLVKRLQRVVDGGVSEDRFRGPAAGSRQRTPRQTEREHAMAGRWS